MSLAAYPAGQEAQRARLYAAHQARVDDYWDATGSFVWKNPAAHGGYRAMLWHCLSYLAGDSRCVGIANQIIQKNVIQTACHFTPGAAVDVLYYYADKLEPLSKQALVGYLEKHLPFLSTDDLQIHGYNDNHVYKAAHALIVAGEMLGQPQSVERGLLKLRQAETVFRRTSFPCEYNSPNYTPVSLCPLAAIGNQASSEEARALAYRLEQFYWQDIAQHFDARVGLPAGPFSRAYAQDYEGLLSHLLCLLTYLFPARFAIDLITEVFDQGEQSALIDPSFKVLLPFLLAHTVWFARADYHLSPEIEEALFTTVPGTLVRGTTESGTYTVAWQDKEKQPQGAPDTYHGGPRHTLLTTYFGDSYSLGTAQYSWLDNKQAHGFYASVIKGSDVKPQSAAPYYARLFLDEEYPFAETPHAEYCFRDSGEIRTVQEQGTALVFYNPIPYTKRFRRLRTGVFRPLTFSRPVSLWVGETCVPSLNHISAEIETVAIDEGDVYVGILPLRLTDWGQSRRAGLHIQAYHDHLAILISSFEGWQPEDFTFPQIMETHTGFVFTLRPAADFASFAAFRASLAEATVEDTFYADMRTTTYQSESLTLSASYSPYQSAFRYVSVNGLALPGA